MLWDPTAVHTMLTKQGCLFCVQWRFATTQMKSKMNTNWMALATIQECAANNVFAQNTGVFWTNLMDIGLRMMNLTDHTSLDCLSKTLLRHVIIMGTSSKLEWGAGGGGKFLGPTAKNLKLFCPTESFVVGSSGPTAIGQCHSATYYRYKMNQAIYTVTPRGWNIATDKTKIVGNDRRITFKPCCLACSCRVLTAANVLHGGHHGATIHVLLCWQNAPCTSVRKPGVWCLYPGNPWLKSLQLCWKAEEAQLTHELLNLFIVAVCLWKPLTNAAIPYMCRSFKPVTEHILCDCFSGCSPPGC